MATKWTKKVTSNAVEILHQCLIEGDPKMENLLAEAEHEMDVAEQIYNLRIESNLSRRALAEKIGTRASVIRHLENADYEGDSLSMLRRIASALHRLDILQAIPRRDKYGTCAVQRETS